MSDETTLADLSHTDPFLWAARVNLERAERAEAENARLLEVMWRWAEFSLCATTRQALREACELSPTHDNSHKAALAPQEGTP